MKDNIALEVKDLHKSFRLPKEHASEIKRAFINFIRGIRGYHKQTVLDGISFTVKKGDFFGIVGKNGSGKSTMLKLISGIYEPDSGMINVNGSLVSFIELGVGFNGELTGHENVYLNGALMGFSVKEIDAMYDSIVDFAELRDFMGQKLKNYSSGMQVRLAFSCAIRAKSDILVLDEVLAVGDEAFQRKCNDYFEEMKDNNNKTIILVTHNMAAVKQYCNKALMLKDGKIIALGSSEDVADKYSFDNLQSVVEAKASELDLGVRDLKVKLLSPNRINQTDKISLRITYKTTRDVSARIDLSIFDADRNVSLLYDETTDAFARGKGKHTIFYECDLPRLINDRQLIIYVAVNDSVAEERIAYTAKADSPVMLMRRNDVKKIDRKQEIPVGVVKISGKWSKT